MRKGLGGIAVFGLLALVAVGYSGQASSQVWQSNAIRAILAANAGQRPQGHFLPSAAVQMAVQDSAQLSPLGQPFSGSVVGSLRGASPDCGNVFAGKGGRPDDVRAGMGCGLRRQADPSLAANPKDPKNLVIGQSDGAAGFARAGIDYSLDRGARWWSYQAPAGQNQTSTGDHWTFDASSGPSVAFGPDGELYAASVAFDVLHDGYDQLYVLKSNPGYRGEFLHSPDAAGLGGAQVLSASPVGLVSDNFGDPTLFDDRASVAVDRFGGSPLKGNVYVVWTIFDSSCGATGDRYCSSTIAFSKSTDGGATWNGGTVGRPGPPVEISGNNPGACQFGNLFDVNRDPSDCDFDQGAWPVVGADGSVDVVFDNCNATLDGAAGPGQCQQMFVKSYDGGATWTSPVKVADDYATQPEQGLSGAMPNGCPPFRPCLPPNGYVVNDYPSMGVDESTGTLAVFWSDFRDGSFTTDDNGDVVCSPCNSDVFASVSTDGGASWSEAKLVDSSTAAQFLPWGDVDEHGGLHVAYYDRSPHGDEHDGSVGLTLATSTDSGATWRTRRIASADLPNLTPDTNPAQAGFIGDRISLVARGGQVFVAWTDTRGLLGTAEQDTYFARVPRA